MLRICSFYFETRLLVEVLRFYVNALTQEKSTTPTVSQCLLIIISTHCNIQTNRLYFILALIVRLFTNSMSNKSCNSDEPQLSRRLSRQLSYQLSHRAVFFSPISRTGALRGSNRAPRGIPRLQLDIHRQDIRPRDTPERSRHCRRCRNRRRSTCRVDLADQ